MRGNRPGLPGNRLPPGAGVNQKVAHPVSAGVGKKSPRALVALTSLRDLCVQHIMFG